ncbi:endonuclease/exonuclease/phosphatase family metal-dependent hydrolase [Azospirillum lipoferum]|uniref:Endonuclease/exonuclease/phosphatase domain-containing protein n=1 Tax=Azospirillum lipoferum TaxID=193 RepID=A0A5A9GLV3_AZOLI|nr:MULTISPECIES: hypothetical protein [Azospirillum]KAA0595416.1 hypothetical protein FZ942_17510 [Azospirillum lipoferum]MCP1611681.1 endonuclease/exonuclease/phosphatase family metal-dependent hydrolase [Azospirillum lipoferum]MDW5533560.1 hypothetical protein [Azospirillum sp. NL1]
MLTILVWNIEMYGAKFTGNTPVDNLCRMIRDQMIAVIMAKSEAQVVMVQEVRENGIVRLPVVTNLLNSLDQTDWHFDVVKGAVSTGDYPTFDDLFFSQNANNEGYAVFWRGNAVTLQTTAQSQSYGMDATDHSTTADHVIGLVNEGYRFNWVPDGNQMGIAFKGTDTAPDKGLIGFPYSNIPNIVGDDEKDANILSRVNTRRPVMVTVTCNEISFPVVAYHAPVHLNSSIAGTIATMAAGDLCSRTVTGAYNTNAVRVFAGDLNLKTFANGLSAAGMATTAGLTRTMIQNDGDSPATMVRPIDYFNAEYNDDSYLYTARDFAFGSEVVNSVGIYDPVGVLYADRTLAEILTSNEGIMDLLFDERSYIAHLPLPNQELEGGEWPDVLAQYLGVLDGTVSETDQINICSVFYRIFVSDHIPVQITLT